MAIVIDFSGKEPPKKTPVPPTDQPLTTEAPSACKHTRALVSESLVERLDAEIAALPPDAGAEGATGSEALPSNSVIVALQK